MKLSDRVLGELIGVEVVVEDLDICDETRTVLREMFAKLRDERADHGGESGCKSCDGIVPRVAPTEGSIPSRSTESDQRSTEDPAWQEWRERARAFQMRHVKCSQGTFDDGVPKVTKHDAECEYPSEHVFDIIPPPRKWTPKHAPPCVCLECVHPSNLRSAEATAKACAECGRTDTARVKSLIDLTKELCFPHCKTFKPSPEAASEELRFIISYLAHNDQDANHAWMVRRIRAVLAGKDPSKVEPWSEHDGVRRRESAKENGA